MQPTKTKETHETLDPQDWEQTRQLMHQMVDDALDYTKTLRDRKIWQPMPEAVLDSFKSKLPQEPQDGNEVYQAFKTTIMPYTMGNVHPRFWAWYMGSGLLSGALGDFWTSILNPNLGGGNHSGHQVEVQVMNWIKDIMQFPESSSGLMVSGGSVANFTALAIARNVKAGYDIRANGMSPEQANKMVVYGSAEVHSCNQKALELLGMGARSLVKIPVHTDYTMNVEFLKAQIVKDRAAGLQPICVIGTPGTVNTGAIDDLNALADICEKEGLWFHVDGAIGAIAMISDVVRPQLAGIERADSVALDLHKWLHMPFEAGCVLVKQSTEHKNTFSLIPEYLEKNTRGVASGEDWFSEYGLQLSRRFRALKVWMSLKEHGVKRFGRMIDKNVAQAHYLGQLIANHNHLELIAPIGLDIVCFRYNPGGQSLEALNALNKEIKLQLEERAIALPGYTTLQGRYCIRVAISNHRTRQDDLDDLVHYVVAIGEELR
ncbi:pyridoxal phosphate-dependent decarboxylase family protein [Flavobacteriaceae bacterium LMO-SS05]